MKSTSNGANHGVMNFRKHGKLAYVHCGKRLDLMILKSNAGWYIGTADEEGPCSRESVEYFTSQEAAKDALSNGQWSQKESP
jgi:hypothetical protein